MMADWSDGYVTNTEYTSHFYPFLSPSSQNFALMLAGIMPVDLNAGYTYCELGCGQGYTTAVLAASNPNGRFWGVDFNPAHIAGANKMKAAAGLSNVEFLEKSFAELAGMADLPSFDFIALHGVWSWISAANRAAIAAFIYARLKPGGVVYISYNALPGWAGLAPLRQLMVESQRHKSDIDSDAVEKAIMLAKRMSDLGAGYFKVNPAATANLEQISKSSRNYLLHEYFNRDWAPSYFSEVAAELRPSKLSFGCSSDLIEQIDQICLRPEAQALLLEQQDPIARETIRDFFRNPRFRRDLFTRGARKMTAAERIAALQNQQLVLVAPPPSFPLQMAVPIGSITLPAEPGTRIVALLGERPMTMRQLLADPELAKHDHQTVFQMVLMLVTRGAVQPVLATGAAEAGHDAAVRFNRAMLMQPAAIESHTLASPVLGNGFAVTHLDQFIMALESGGGAMTAERLLHETTRRGMKLRAAQTGEAKPIDTAEGMQALLNDYHENRVPLYQRLGVID